jgi:hypothetical protein
MAGGIFTDRPFHVNPKCVWFSILVMLYYWYATDEPNTWLLPVLAAAAYVLLAWYDYRYNCDDQLIPGKLLDVTGIFKPEATTRDESKTRKNPGTALAPDQNAEYLRAVYVFHAVVLAPFLIYVGYTGTDANPKSFGVLLAFGVIALLYHGVRFFFPRL